MSICSAAVAPMSQAFNAFAATASFKSIARVEPSPTTTAITQTPLEAPATRPSPIQASDLLLPFAVAAVALAIAWVLGGFRRNSVVGPPRLTEPAVSPPMLWILTLLGVFVWGLAPNIYAAFRPHRVGNVTTATAIATTRIASALDSPATNQTTTRTAADEANASATKPSTTATSKHAEPQPSAETFSTFEIVAVNTAVPLIAFAALIGMDAFFFPSRSKGRRSLAAQLGYSPRHMLRGIVPGILGAVVAVPLVFAASVITQWTVQALHLSRPHDHALIQIFKDPESSNLRYLVMSSAVIAAPLFEELLFRGHLQTALAATFTAAARLLRPGEVEFTAGTESPVGPPVPTAAARWGAIVLTAAMFAAVHESGWMMPPLFVLAVVIGYVYERTGNLWAAITVHAAFNALSIAQVMLNFG